VAEGAMAAVEGGDFAKPLKIPQAIPEGKSRRNHFFFSIQKKWFLRDLPSGIA